MLKSSLSSGVATLGSITEGKFKWDWAQIVILIVLNREAASAGLGNPNHPEAYLEVVADRAEANLMFVTATMDEDIKVL